MSNLPADTHAAMCGYQATGNSADCDCGLLGNRPSKEQDKHAASAYADKHAPVVPNHRALVKTCVAEAYLAGLAAGRAPETSDELTVKFPRAWAPYLQAVILGALGDMDGDGDCRWHLNELQKFLGRASEKTNGDVGVPMDKREHQPDPNADQEGRWEGL